ncbi:SCO family protein [Rhodovulum sulfidophilum]|uniref:SCO family protein n=1 Tax=Rhodovulum visakhapatnamense TaxID=364297 RepID=A0ABS1RAG0_9RHOB|nr:SCO family protein [Rhodovulum visakhapatnamense]MBL3568238.1 SCO family protein [Rhodovulum visakhapatnamense]MBL3576624.1 SCO family protein [Rhodovulum visakhapatnamense]OLS43190.1 SCO family protein [Rhodovulum sulfidophilum]
MRRYILAGAALALLAAVAVPALFIWGPWAPEDRFAACRSGGSRSGLSELGGPFTLTDQTGAVRTETDVIDGPTLIYFGYTFCPDVCPFDNARNADAVDLLERQGYQVRPVFISVDPARDTPEALAAFASMMHPRMLALTGTPDQVQAASRAYRTFFRIRDPEDPYYLIDHSTFTYLAFPETGVVEVFDRDTTPEDMAARVACLVDNGAGKP